MKIVVHGHLEAGQHALQRADALSSRPDLRVVRSPIDTRAGGRAKRALNRVLSRLGRPIDLGHENRQLLKIVRETRPDAVLIDNSRVLRPATLAAIREETGALLAYFCPDDAFSPAVRSIWLQRSFPFWDLFFTTKSFNLSELRDAGVGRAVLIGNIFDPELHRPMTPDQVGPEFEAYDLVFVGAYEEDRCNSIAKLAQAGFTVVVYGYGGLLSGSWQRLKAKGVTVRDPVWGRDYVRAMHTGKLALGFLRKANRDVITQRSIEVPAMGRTLLAEKTDEHDQHFIDGVEYVAFGSDDELAREVTGLLADDIRRHAIGAAGRERCLTSRYDVQRLAEIIEQEISTDVVRKTRRAVR